MRDFFLLILGVCVFLPLPAQKNWTGTASGKWADPNNWLPYGVPAPEDVVTLSNFFVNEDYSVTMPDTAVKVRKLILSPDTDHTILLVIPVSNKFSPALIISDSGIDLQINHGGTIRNSSGLSSGQSIQANGLIAIANGGRYIHNSRSSHATEIVARLSTAAGTEYGVFEFDVPGGAYPISLSNRIYGTLVLSSEASGGNQTYNASGTNTVIINGNLQINNGVQFNLDLTKDLTLHGDYLQNGGIFNIASQPDNNTVKIKGSFTGTASAVITETSTGLPTLEFCGDGNQQLSFAGTLANSVTIKVNNKSGITLISPLTLNYRLQLTEGVIKTSVTNLLTLQDNCTTDGASATSFINGPMLKNGDDDFEFPLGKQGNYAPLAITGSNGGGSDEFMAEYFTGDPGTRFGSSIENPPVLRISKLEYWQLDQKHGSSSKKVRLSVGNFSDATELSSLVVTRWNESDNRWQSEGNSVFAGLAVGSLTSNDTHNFGALTLGSIVPLQNPLPSNYIKLGIAYQSDETIKLLWNLSERDATIVDHFEIEQSHDGLSFDPRASLQFIPGLKQYQYVVGTTNIYYRIKLIFKAGNYLYSTPVKISGNGYRAFNISTCSMQDGAVFLGIEAINDENVFISVTDVSGREVQHANSAVHQGYNKIIIKTTGFAKGLYFVRVFDTAGHHAILRTLVCR